LTQYCKHLDIKTNPVLLCVALVTLNGGRGNQEKEHLISSLLSNVVYESRADLDSFLSHHVRFMAEQARPSSSVREAIKGAARKIL